MKSSPTAGASERFCGECPKTELVLRGGNIQRLQPQSAQLSKNANVQHGLVCVCFGSRNRAIPVLAREPVCACVDPHRSAVASVAWRCDADWPLATARSHGSPRHGKRCQRTRLWHPEAETKCSKTHNANRVWTLVAVVRLPYHAISDFGRVVKIGLAGHSRVWQTRHESDRTAGAN